MKKSSLRLAETIKHTLKTSGLTKLIFDEDNALLQIADSKNKFIVNNLEFHEREEVIDRQISGREYIRLIVPVYSLQGAVRGILREEFGFMGGIIRPQITGEYACPEIVPCIPPEFHFSIYGEGKGYTGRSTSFCDDVLAGGMIEQKKGISFSRHAMPSFRVNLPSDYTKIFFKRGG